MRAPSCPTSLLFIYGSLKQGMANHHHMAGASYLGETWIDGVDLHDLGPFPMAIGGSGRIHGELYRVDAPHLERLDRFEGTPRLYQRQQRALPDGRPVWIYLGQPRQVRHSPRLEQGLWPGLLGATAALAGLLPAPGLAQASLGLCLRWQHSSGLERVRLGNAIGAASHLTKQTRLAESDDAAPVPLYRESDLHHACSLWR